MAAPVQKPSSAVVADKVQRALANASAVAATTASVGAGALKRAARADATRKAGDAAVVAVQNIATTVQAVPYRAMANASWKAGGSAAQHAAAALNKIPVTATASTALKVGQAAVVVTYTAGGKVLQVAHEHPVAAAAVLGAVAAPIVVPATLGVVGFGHGGVAGGSMAAGIQSGIGNVAAGSLFAVAQSVGAAGLPVGAKLALSTAGGGAAAAIAGKYKIRARL